MNAKPLLKWAGGKRWLTPILQDLWGPLQHDHVRLVEPFTGGMAVALGLDPVSALLNDGNVHLVNFYHQVQKGLQIKKTPRNESAFYYSMREKFNQLIHKKKHLTPEAAGIFYFLMRTGFNGLCRFNRSGQFNVPFGQHKNIRYISDFSEYSTLLNKWTFSSGDFEALSLEKTDFLYADPPYDVTFTKYCCQDFSWTDQIRLAHWLNSHEGPVIASNQATPRILELYNNLGFSILTLPAPRRIACNGNRQPAIEMLALKNIPTKIIRNCQTTHHL
jgi:DNA adenine methylase